ncbi:VWA domain-containing protein [Mechercharimyces sp. CAU 1602]|uniref:VWA domain-containing protein n=1 Tax=Mechercharimyces sp. CAU 1602 TaxID=2973933 RepID=UPI002161DF8B|nr:VWA domain-containing protein [Mechercharimyces sp. CAU 1602]
MFIITVCVAIFIVGCSNNSTTKEKAESTSNNKIEKEQKEFVPAEDAEGMLREGPGKYAGDRYDQAKLEKELDQFPDNLTAEEAYKRIIPLLAADYGPLVEKIEKFDTSLVNPNDMPSEASEKGMKKKAPKTYVTILLDASGSMAGQVEGGKKMDLAKAAVQRFVASLPEEVEISLRVYGHKGSNSEEDKKKSCEAIEEVYASSPYEKERFDQALLRFNPTGWTPLAGAISETREELLRDAEERTQLVYIMSDGIETCDGDPVKEVRKLHDENIKSVINIIGFDVDDQAQQQLKEMAEVGEGSYETVDSAESLRAYFDDRNQDLWSEWFDWGVQSSLDLFDMKADKLEYISDEVNGTFIDEINNEYVKLHDAGEYLLLKEKMRLAENIEYSKILTKRESKLDEYRESQEDLLRQAVEKNYDNLNQEIERKQEEMTKSR